MDVLHGDLETIETSGLRDLHLLGEALHLGVTRPGEYFRMFEVAFRFVIQLKLKPT